MILIFGGVRSGKSKFALALIKKQCKKAAYIATAPVCDDEMRLRIARHRKSRPADWITIEAQRDLIPCLKKIPRGCDGLIIECIGTYISNLMMRGCGDGEILKNIRAILKRLEAMNKKVFIVSNEVGMGVVPGSAAGRRFRDIVGSVNQIIAMAAEEVYFTVAGLPLKIK